MHYFLLPFCYLKENAMTVFDPRWHLGQHRHRDRRVRARSVDRRHHRGHDPAPRLLLLQDLPEQQLRTGPGPGLL